MSTLEIWLTIVGLTGVTVVTRSFFLVLGDHVPLPERVQHALRYAPACALTALIAPEVLMVKGGDLVAWNDPKLIAAAVAVGAMLATRSMLATMAIGMAVFTALRLWG
jgi:branched-subunit amino acid transport protein